MAKLLFIVIGGCSLVLLVAYGANAEFNVVQGRTIPDRQQEVLAGLVLAWVILGSAVSSWFKYWGSDPARWRNR